jgi:hypothetical protein
MIFMVQAGFPSFAYQKSPEGPEKAALLKYLFKTSVSNLAWNKKLNAAFSVHNESP